VNKSLVSSGENFIRNISTHPMVLVVMRAGRLVSSQFHKSLLSIVRECDHTEEQVSSLSMTNREREKILKKDWMISNYVIASVKW
jgi:hypothetical protein